MQGASPSSTHLCEDYFINYTAIQSRLLSDPWLIGILSILSLCSPVVLTKSSFDDALICCWLAWMVSMPCAFFFSLGPKQRTLRHLILILIGRIGNESSLYAISLYNLCSESSLFTTDICLNLPWFVFVLSTSHFEHAFHWPWWSLLKNQVH